MEATDASPGREYVLESPTLPLIGPYQVHFWLHRFGEHMGELRVDELQGPNKVNVTLWDSPADSYTGELLSYRLIYW